MDPGHWITNRLSSPDYLSTMNNTTNPTIPFYRNFIDCRVAIGIWELILCVVGAPMNALVGRMSICIMRKHGHSNQHLCILSMAMADFIFASTHSPLMFINYGLSTDLDLGICQSLYFFTHFSSVASSLSLLCLNVDKFISLRCPLRYHSILTYKRTKLIIIVSWLLSLAWALFFVFGSLTVFEEQCQVYPDEPHAYVLFFILFFVLPISLSVAISFYILLLAIEARKTEYGKASIEPEYHKQNLLQNFIFSSRNRSTVPKILVDLSDTDNITTALREISEQERPASTLKTVTFVFITTLWSSITFIPYRTIYLFYHFHPEDWIARIAFPLFALMVSNSCGNSFITIITQYQYREATRKIMGKWRNKFNVGEPNEAIQRSIQFSSISVSTSRLS